MFVRAAGLFVCYTQRHHGAALRYPKIVLTLLSIAIHIDIDTKVLIFMCYACGNPVVAIRAPALDQRSSPPRHHSSASASDPRYFSDDRQTGNPMFSTPFR